MTKQHKRAQSSRRLRLEPLEIRQLLDASGPSLVPDTFQVPQNGEARTLEVLANDSFGDDYTGARQITSVSTGNAGGRLEIGSDGQSLRYRPPADFAGPETFAYFVDGVHAAGVTVDVVGLVTDDFYFFRPDGEVRNLDVLKNDPFLADYTGARRITIVSETSLGGELELSADGKSLSYTMPAGAYGKDTFTYIVDDRFPARVTIDIPDPLVRDSGELVQNDPAHIFNVVANDHFWPEYDGPRQITHVFGSHEGSVLEISADGKSLSYQPGPDFQGYETVRYVVDGQFESQLGLRVHRPTRDDFATVDTGSREFFIALTDNDHYRSQDGSYKDIVERVTSVGTSAEGATISISADGRGVLYTAPADFIGSDVFEYTADGSYPATVRVSVTEPVRDDSELVRVDTADNRLDVLSNDFFGNGYGGARRITSVGTTSAGGIVEISGDGKHLSYTPPDDARWDSFEYEVDNEFRAQVRLHISSLTSDDHYRFGSPGEEVLFVLENDHFGDAYAGPGIITSVSTPSNGGSVTIIEGGTALLYSPGSGEGSFAYTVDDKHQGQVWIRYPQRLAYDQAIVDQNDGPTPISVLDNDFQYSWVEREWGEYEGPRLITDVGETRNGGTVEISADGKQVIYTPAPDFHGDDSFSYTVDCFLQATATVHVVRRVQDDLFRVDTDDAPQQLTVLLNDLLGADYTGSGTITEVTPTSAGGLAQVAADGTHLIYQPSAGFAGEDTFTYTVDGQLKATVTVKVEPADAVAFERFEELASFRDYLIEDAVSRYESLFGTTAGEAFRHANYQLSLAGPTADGTVYSETNVQVAGVDEADLVETDGEFIYSLSGNSLAISRARPTDELTLVSQTKLTGSPIGQYLDGDRLAVVTRELVAIPYDDSFRSTAWIEPTSDLIFPPYPRSSRTFVTIFDVGDRAAPRVVQRTELDGNYVESRRIGDYVFVVLDSGAVTLPHPETKCDANDNCAYESREEYIERVRSTFESLVAEALPSYSSSSADGNSVRSGLLIQPEDIFKPQQTDGGNLISVLSFDLTNNELGLASTAGILASGAANVYGTLDDLYVFEDRQGWRNTDGSTTRILKFSWDASDGSVRPAAIGTVPGRMVNQFAADEHDGYLRLATTVSNQSSGNYSGRPENQLFVLSDDRGVLEFTSRISNLAVDETIRSVRFFGERAFVTTFRDVDPLFALDLSDPEAPEVLGHLTLPGYSQYLHFVTPDRLLTVGPNTPNGGPGPVMVSLIEVSDPIQPVRVDNFTLPRYSVSEATIDHHAFGWFGHHDVLALPSARSFRERFDRDEDGYRESLEWVSEHQLYSFHIDVDASPGENAITLQGTIEHDSAVRRSVFINDTLYSIADRTIIATDINDPQDVYGEIIVQPDSEVVVPDDLATAVRERIEGLQTKARAHLAASTGAAIESIMTVTSEADSHRDRFKMVLRAADELFAYVAEGDQIVATESNYAFTPSGNELQWHNQGNAYDVNGDGIVAPRDVGLIVNDVNRVGFRQLPLRSVVRQMEPDHFYLDVNNDGLTSALDVLSLINHINQRSLLAEGEGQASFWVNDDPEPNELGKLGPTVAPNLMEPFSQSAQSIQPYEGEPEERRRSAARQHDQALGELVSDSGLDDGLY